MKQEPAGGGVRDGGRYPGFKGNVTEHFYIIEGAVLGVRGDSTDLGGIRI